MANVLIFNICLALVLSRAESCFIPNSVYVHVPQTIEAGSQITKVEVADCDTKSTHLTADDPSFTIEANGQIVALTGLQVATRGRTFSVLARDNSGLESEMTVHLIRSETQEKKGTGSGAGQGLLKRSKRRWSPPPFNLLENEKGPFPKNIEKIVSDSASTREVYYTFSGPGFDLPPKNVFSLNRETGMLSVHQPVDREEYPSFTLVVEVFDKNTNQPTDDPLPITIMIDDENDNAPTFKGPMQFTVPERSKAGTVVGTVEATDRDKEGTEHVKIRYKLLTDTDMFAINPQTGIITTATNTLDRETKDKYLVAIEIRDWDGLPKGLPTTGTATITLGDINDNPPTFKKSSYDVTVNENEVDKLLLRIPVEDKDLINTPNWISQFVITKGNENKNFRIETDPKTNEGLLYVSKALDHEKTKDLKLEIMARNQAELTGTTSQWVSIPVNVAVTDVDEGPQFTAPTIKIPVKENTPNGTLIGTYTAVDPETKSSDGIKYYKTTDPGSWVTVDKNTGELRVANTIDRESPLVQNGIYNVTMKAVDASSKTGMGTVLLVVEDVNDNKPTLPNPEQVLCEKDGELGSVLVVAEDNDHSPYSDPFSFSMPDDHDGKWSLERFNNTAATLKQIKALHQGIHEVPVHITDLQGFGETQTVKVRICQCRNGVCPPTDRSVSLGGLALLTMLLPLALLLLLGLLLAFFCVTRRDTVQIEDGGDSGGILLKSNTEAPGEEVDASLLNVPTAPTVFDPAVKGSVKGSMLNSGWLGNKSASTIGGQSIHENGNYKSGIITTNDMQEYYSGQFDSQYGGGGQLLGSRVDFDNRYLVQDSTLPRTWQTNGRYLQQKLVFLGTEEDGRYADDMVHAYGFEGVGSAAGSIGCCSDYADNDDLDFLNTLGPKFKTLADVCTKR